MTNKKEDSFLGKENNAIKSNFNGIDTFNSTPVYAAGESVDQHKQIEEANEYFSEKEIKQSNNN